MAMNCPGCGSGIPPEGIRKASAFAVCPSCGRITDLVHRPATVPPRGVTLEREGGRIRIRIPWSRAEKKGVGITVACLSAVTLLLLIWRPGALPAMFGGHGADTMDREVGMLQMFVGGLAAVCGAAWWISSVNVTHVVVERGVIRSWTGPLSNRLPTVVEAEGALQFHCVKVLAHEPRRMVERVAVGMMGDDAYRFTVCGAFRDGRVVEMVPRLLRPEEALFVEGILEREFGIRDVPVHGELRTAYRVGGPIRPA
jgi:hypothetical protein